MKQKSLFILTFAVFLSLPASPNDLLGSQSGRIPAYIASRYGPTSYAAWISARSVLGSDGKLDVGALPIGMQISIQKQIESGDYERQGCVQTLEVSIDLAGPQKARGTLGDLARNSIGILRGEVTGIDYGFGSYGTPALLLEVLVEERIKGSSKIADSPYVYFEYPVASFEAGGYRFCKKDSRWPEPPEIGDSVMLFPYRQPGDTADQVIVPLPDGFEVIFERKKDRSLIVPRALRDDPDLIGAKRLDTVRERAAEHLRKSTHPESSNF